MKKIITFCLLIVSTYSSSAVFASSVNKDSLNISELYNNSENFFRQRFIKLSDLGFAENEDSKNKWLNIKKSVTFKNSPAPKNNVLSAPLATTSNYLAKAKATINKVKKNQLFLSAMNGLTVELPYGVSKTIGNKTYTVCIDSIVLTPTHAYAIIYAGLPQPRNNNDSIFFGAKITLARDGGFAVAGGKLFLLENANCKFGKNNSIEFVGNTSLPTFIEFDCNGFKKLRAEILVTLLKGKAIKDIDSSAIEDVTFSSKIEFDDFENWLLEFTDIPKFKFKEDLQGFSFDIGTITLDHHLGINSSNFVFPSGYTEGNSADWQGFCVQGLEVILPETFNKSTRDSLNRIKFSVDYAIIDDIGFTGKLTGDSLIIMSDSVSKGGDMNGWDWSLDYISLEIFKQNFKKMDFKGKVKIPITDTITSFEYTGIIEQENYDFTLVLKDNIDLPLWGAGNAEFFADSELRVAVVNKKFIPEAILSGKISISASINGTKKENVDEGKKASMVLADINFQKLHVSTTAPYLFLDPAGGAFSVGSPLLSQKLSNLPVTISEIGLRNDVINDEGVEKHLTGIYLTVNVNLTGEEDSGKGFGASGSATIWGYKDTKMWKYYRCELQKIEIKKVDIGPLKMAGFIEFFRDDLTYGTGFQGKIALEIQIKKPDKISLDIAAIFGKIMLDSGDLDYRYWAVDAYAGFPAVPIYSPFISVNGFGGGASYKMKMSNESPSGEVKFTSLTGTKYVPDKTTGLGLKSMIGIQGELSQAYNGKLNFEIVFSETGSVDFVGFSGFVKFASFELPLGPTLTDLQQMAAKVSNNKPLTGDSAKVSDPDMATKASAEGFTPTAIMAQWSMEMDFAEKIFTADMSVFFNAGVIVGGMAPAGSNKAGGINILFSEDEWYIRLGTPASPMRLKLGLLDAILKGKSKAGVESYMLMGNKIIDSIAAPEGFVGTWKLPDASVGNLSGFAYGNRIGMLFKKEGTFNYSISSWLGFDVMIFNAGNRTCSETGQVPGINGWYASGMAYMFVNAKAGLKTCINVPYLTCKKFWKSSCWSTKQECVDQSVGLEVGRSVSLGGPNPTNAAMSIDVLGKSIGVQVGENCTF